MQILVQMDRVETINPNSDSTFQLALEAQKRGFALFYCTPKQLYLAGDQVKARIRSIEFYENQEQFFAFKSELTECDLVDFDIILVRQDPPFDMRYITNTYLLSKIENKVRIINNPTSIRDNSEKIYAHDYSQYMPKTIISEDLEIIKQKYKEIGEVVLKPLYAFGGRDVIYIAKDQEKKLEDSFAKLIETYQTPIILQQYLPEIIKGDCRVLLASGQIVGQVLRVAASGQIAANLCAGGSAEFTTLSKKQQAIALEIAQDCKNKKLEFVGLDFIGDYLTEINVTSPTGIKQASELMQENVAKKIWDAFLQIK